MKKCDCAPNRQLIRTCRSKENHGTHHWDSRTSSEIFHCDGRLQSRRDQWSEALESQRMLVVANGRGGSWTGRVVSVADTPSIVLQQPDGNRVNLPQSYTLRYWDPVTDAEPVCQGAGLLGADPLTSKMLQSLRICGKPSPGQQVLLCGFPPDHGWSADDRLTRRHSWEPPEHQEQPPPVPNGGPSAHDLVIRDLSSREPNWDLSFGKAAAIRDRVCDDLAARKQLGLERYGSLLQPGNGRDALRDAYEEAMDLVCYLRQHLFELDERGLDYLLLADVYDTAVASLVTLKRVQLSRQGSHGDS